MEKKISALLIGILVLTSLLVVHKTSHSYQVVSIPSTYSPKSDITFLSGIIEGIDNEPTMKDNAAHFRYYQDDPHILQWREWWYLNIKTVEDHRVVIMFLTAGNLKNPFGSIAAIIMVLMKDDGTTFWTMTPTQSSNYIPDYEKCNVQIGHNTFTALDNTTYSVMYKNPLHSLTLNATLTKTRRGIKHGNCVTSLGDWEVMGWCIPVSYGNVTGYLEYQDKEGTHNYSLAGGGYHDHNWGLLEWRNLCWDWGAFTDPSFPFSIVYGRTHYKNRTDGNINIVNATHMHSISSPDFTIEYSKWTQLGWYTRPSQLQLSGKEQNGSINITVDLLHPYIIGIKNIGHPYLLGQGYGTFTLGKQPYTFSKISGFYEFHAIKKGDRPQ